MTDIVDLINGKTGLDIKVIKNIIQLLDEGNTIPFIARYRKELTKGASDEQLRNFQDIYEYTKNLAKRKEDVIRLIDEKGLLTPDLEKQINEAETLARVEDLYRPFKEKKNTKATIAKYRGLEPLAKLLRECKLSKEDFIKEAEKIVELVKQKRQSLSGEERKKADDILSKYN